MEHAQHVQEDVLLVHQQQHVLLVMQVMCYLMEFAAPQIVLHVRATRHVLYAHLDIS